ncbi:DUF1801 domain-containing protein [Nocardia yamanashiensis]|uniref:DUF1801 domain-containing protein n=1 Tax=Nocardia yamanashiensis TaxID=209247 RepID=UPI001E2EF5F6|nr:DUF1801 domain-containing protein [Nocardia yamanashiensis]UGT43637.1 DUF1801 domain-containing protein [Nocardia yamanashiensis]
MAKNGSVADILNELDTDRREQVTTLQSIILETEPSLEEHVKWSAPSYVLDGEDRVTFNLKNKDNKVQLILHMGSTRKEDKKAAPVMEDPSGLVQWASDIRGILSFDSLDDIKAKQPAVEQILRRWLAIG